MRWYNIKKAELKALSLNSNLFLNLGLEQVTCLLWESDSSCKWFLFAPQDYEMPYRKSYIRFSLSKNHYINCFSNVWWCHATLDLGIWCRKAPYGKNKNSNKPFHVWLIPRAHEKRDYIFHTSDAISATSRKTLKPTLL